MNLARTVSVIHQMMSKYQKKFLQIGTEESQLVKSFLLFCERGKYEEERELEIRFQSITKEMFLSLMTMIERDKMYRTKQVQESFIKYYSKNYRIEFGLNQKPLLCQQKREIKYHHLTFNKQTLKFSWSQEYTLHSVDRPDLAAVSKCMKDMVETGTRKKKRVSYSFDDFKIDMTHVINSNTFEVEIEFITIPSYQNVFIIVKYILFSIHPNKLSFIGQEVETRVRQSYQKVFQNNSSKDSNEPVPIHFVWENKCKNLKPYHMATLNHSVTNKLNGVNYFLFFNLEDYCLYLINHTTVESIGCLDKTIITFTQSFILQGEWFKNKLYLFDLLYFQGNNCTSCNHLKRHLILQSFEPLLKDAIKDSNICHFQVEMKKFYGVDVQNIETDLQFKELTSSQLFQNINDCKNSLSCLENGEIDMEENDGLIFTPLNEPYFNQTTYKFKFPETMSIDFTIKQRNTLLINSSTTSKDKLYDIFVYDDKRQLVPFTYANKVYQMECVAGNEFEHLLKDNQVIECKFNTEKSIFVPMKIRYDKNLPNYCRVAEDVFQDILDPLSLDTFLTHLVVPGTITFVNTLPPEHPRSYRQSIKRKIQKLEK